METSREPKVCKSKVCIRVVWQWMVLKYTFSPLNIHEEVQVAMERTVKR